MLKIEIGWKFMRFHFLSGIWENKWQRRVTFLTSNSVKLPVIRAHKPIVNLHLEQKIHTTRIFLLHWIYLSSLESKNGENIFLNIQIYLKMKWIYERFDKWPGRIDFHIINKFYTIFKLKYEYHILLTFIACPWASLRMLIFGHILYLTQSGIY